MLPGVVPAVVPDVAPAVPMELGELVAVLLVVVLGPVLLLLPPIPLPVELVVWAPATPNASRSAGAANHVLRILFYLQNVSALRCVDVVLLPDFGCILLDSQP